MYVLGLVFQLPRLVEVTDYESFNAFVKKEKKADPHLAEMLKFIPDLKWSLDESMTTIGYVYHQVSELHVLYSYSSGKLGERRFVRLAVLLKQGLVGGSLYPAVSINSACWCCLNQSNCSLVV